MHFIIHNDAPNGTYLVLFIQGSICFQHYRTSVSHLLYIYALLIQVESTSKFQQFPCDFLSMHGAFKPLPSISIYEKTKYAP